MLGTWPHSSPSHSCPRMLLVVLVMLIGACNASTYPPTTLTTTTTIERTGGNMPTELTLPPRPGEQPSVTSGIPHIQLDQTSSEQMIAALSDWAFTLEGVSEQPSRASLPGARALTVEGEIPINRQAVIVGREFAHIHPIPNGGGSLHLRLMLEDAQEVVDSGWGEWHPFALDGTMPGMVMVYAPRSDQDLDVVKSIVQASATFAISTGDGE